MTRPRDVTVVVCTRDRADLLRGALAAIRSSLPPEAEVLVVDSGSTTSDTRRVADESGVRYVRSDVPGLSIARNVGLRASSREIVVFTDDDCEATAGWIESLSGRFADGVGAVTGRLVDGSTDPGPAAPARTLSRTRDGLDAGHGAVMAFRRRLVLELGGFDEVLGAGRRAAGAEDLDMFCRVLRSGARLVVEPAAIVRHVYTRDDAAFLALNRGYGRGLGAMSSKWLRLSVSEGTRLTVLMVARALRRALRRRGGPRTRRGARALLGGIGTGFVEALPQRVEGERFVDRRPPAPILLPSEADDRRGRR